MDELTGSHVSPSTYDRVLERDGECCWLCSNEPHNIMADVHVAQLIDTTSNQWFTQCQQNGPIPTTNVDHQDNLVPLCPSCHSSFDDAGFPGMDFRPWHKKTIQKYIDHEKSDYEQRLLLSTPNSPVPRSLSNNWSEHRSLPSLDTHSPSLPPYTSSPLSTVAKTLVGRTNLGYSPGCFSWDIGFQPYPTVSFARGAENGKLGFQKFSKH